MFLPISEKPCQQTTRDNREAAFKKELMAMASLSSVLLCICSVLCVPVRSQSPAATPDHTPGTSPLAFPSSNEQVSEFLVQSLNWYHSVTAAEQLEATPADLIFIEDNQPLASQILRLSSEFARADAGLAAPTHNVGASSPTSTNASDLSRILSLKRQLDHTLEGTTSDVQRLTKDLSASSGPSRRRIQAALDDAQSRLALIESESKTVAKLAEFVGNAVSSENHGDDFASVLDDFARGVSDGSGLSLPSAQSLIQAAASRQINAEHHFGILGLLSDATMAERKLRRVDEMLRQTESLLVSEQSLRKPMAALVNQIIEEAVSGGTQNSDLSTLQANKEKLDSLTAEVNSLSPSIVALDEQKALLTIYRAHITAWRSAIVLECKKAWKRLLIHSIAVVSVIVLLLVCDRMFRHAVESKIQDPDRRRIFALARKVSTVLALCAVGAIGLGAEWKSFATFFGLLTAGIAVALQNVILASVGYFLLIGKHGIRVGDRVQFSGVTGDVIEVGLLQFQLKEFDADKHEFTGRIATFSNSFVFISPASGLMKMEGNSSEVNSPTSSGAVRTLELL